MNEQLQQALINWISSLKDLAWDQLPDIVRQYITYSRIATTVWCSISLIALVVSAIVFFRTIKVAKRNEWGRIDYTDAQASLMVIFGFAGVLGAIVLAMSLDPMVSAWFSPKAHALAWLLKLIH